MDKPKHIKFLEELNKTGIGMDVNIAPFITNNFQCDSHDKGFEQVHSSITLFLNELETKGWISQDKIVSGVWMQFEQDGKLIVEWQSDNNDHALFYHITINGSNELLKYYKKNKSWWDRVPTRLKTIGTIIAIVGGLIAIYQFLISKYNEMHAKKPPVKIEKKKLNQSMQPTTKKSLKASGLDSSRR